MHLFARPRQERPRLIVWQVMKRIEPPLVITKPCSQNWGAMNGDERKRFCAQCGKHVFNLSAMTEREAKTFASESNGDECVSYVRTVDGNIHSPNRFEQRLLWLSARLPRMAAMLALLLPAALASCVQRTMGGIRPADSKETVEKQKMKIFESVAGGITAIPEKNRQKP